MLSVQLKLISVLAFWSVASSIDIDIPSVVENVPENDRLNYLKYHINLGYLLQTQDVYRPTPKLSNGLSIALYEYAKANHKIVDEDLLKQARETICFDDGGCVDLGDVGVHPTRTLQRT